MKIDRQKKQDEDLGRFLSLVLRHNPLAAGVRLDSHGWVQVDDLLAGVSKTGRSLSKETLERIVRENNKQRYSFNEDHTRIRANQGHSIPVDLELKECVPPDILYHGTASRFMGGIRQKGITRQSRQHVHLSADIKTAKAVGCRHGVPVILKINSKAMAADGYHFYQSENGVWLCEQVPKQYVEILSD